MPILPILYFGKPGLDADVFQAYMASSGYPVQMVTGTEGGIPPNMLGASSITVIALEKSHQELLELAHEIRMQSSGCVKRVLILADGQPSDADAAAVEFIHRPYRLSEIVERIRAISRND